MSRKIGLQITAGGGVRMLQADEVDLAELGPIEMTRASHVEPYRRHGGDWACYWMVVSAKTNLVLAYGFRTRAEALNWEKAYFSPGGPGWAELTKEER